MENVEYDDKRGWGDPSSEEGESTGPYDAEQFGHFAEQLNEVWRWKKRMKALEGEVGCCADGGSLQGVDLEMIELEEKVKEVLEAGEELREELAELPAESATTWLLEKHQAEQESRLRWKLNLLSVGLTGEMIADAADDYNHLIQDSHDENGRALRKDLRSRMRELSRDDRRELLRELFESGEIDQGQYAYLMGEFGG